MNIIPINTSFEIVGQLYEHEDVRCLSEDMIEISLPNNKAIWAGWYSYREYDGPGRYIVLLVDTKRQSKILAKIMTSTGQEAKYMIEFLIKHRLLYNED